MSRDPGDGLPNALIPDRWSLAPRNFPPHSAVSWSRHPTPEENTPSISAWAPPSTCKRNGATSNTGT